MGPIVKQAAKDYSDKPVAFVTFDFTSKETTAAAKAAAAKYDVEELYAANERRTAFVLIVDAASGKVIKKITSRDKIAEYHKAIDTALSEG